MTPTTSYKPPGAVAFCFTIARVVVFGGALASLFRVLVFFQPAGSGDTGPAGTLVVSGVTAIVSAPPLFARSAILEDITRCRFPLKAGFARQRGETPPPWPDALHAAIAALPRIDGRGQPFGTSPSARATR